MAAAVWKKSSTAFLRDMPEARPPKSRSKSAGQSNPAAVGPMTVRPTKQDIVATLGMACRRWNL
jgi:hypothetical protein